MATMSQTGVGVGIREPVTVSQGRTVGRPKLSNWALVQPSAAPMPRFGSVCDDKVCRVPKLTRLSIVCRSCAWLTGATIARSFASTDGGGAAPSRLTHIKIAILRIRLSPLARARNWHLALLGSSGAATPDQQN